MRRITTGCSGRFAARPAAEPERWASPARVVLCKLRRGRGMQDSVENLVTLFEHGTLNRQQLIQGLLAALAPISAVANAHADTTTAATFRGRSLNHVTLSVSDVERSKEFYSRLLAAGNRT